MLDILGEYTAASALEVMQNRAQLMTSWKYTYVSFSSDVKPCVLT